MEKNTQLNKVFIDFIAKGEGEHQWLVVLVEEDDEQIQLDNWLYQLQDRLYNCLDSILDGKLAEKFPETSGANIVVRLDCYNVPATEVKEFFDDFSSGVFLLPDYRRGLSDSKFVKKITFELNSN